MKVVIPGGSGFIGSALAAHLASRGDTVLVLSRRSPRESAPGGVSFARWDGHDAQILADLLADADAVVNLTGENIGGRRWTAAQKDRIVHSRLGAGKMLCEALALLEKRPDARLPQVIVQASATGWYGSWPDMATAPCCTEQSPHGDGFLAQTAVAWENSTAELEQRYPQLRRVVIRTAPVLGPQGGLLDRVLPLFRWGLGGPTGSGRQPFAWIHLDDEVAAITFLLDTPLSGPFNLVAPEAVSSREFAKILGKVLQRPALLPVPTFALRLALGEMADELLLRGQRVVPERLLAAGFGFRYPHLSSALLVTLNGAH